MTTSEKNVSLWRTYVCMNRVEEAQGVDSYYLMPKDGKPMASLLPGQYVYIKGNFPSTANSARRASRYPLRRTQASFGSR